CAPGPTPDDAPVGTSGLILARRDAADGLPAADALSSASEAGPAVGEPASGEVRLVEIPYVAPIPPVVLDRVVRPDVPAARPLRAAPSAARTSPSGPTADLQQQEQVIHQTLREYARAFERMDVQAAKALRPSLDARALQRAFEQLDAQQLRLGPCGVSIKGRDANAHCTGAATYHPKVGSRVMHVAKQEWTFNLSRHDGGWQIVDAITH
ncbi:MAG: hypothetical protein ACREUZ_18540, partial [Burkholderiales bacterium]